MTPFRSETILVQLDDERCALVTSRRRRMLYGAVALLLAAVFFIGFDPAFDLSKERLFGTLFVGLLAFGSLFVAGYRRKLVFDRRKDRAELARTLFGIRLHAVRELFLISSLRRLQLIDMRLLPGSGGKEPEGGGHQPYGTPAVSDNGPGSRRGGEYQRRAGFFEQRAHLYRLFAETAVGRFLLQETTYPDEIEQTAQFLAVFLAAELVRTSER